MTTSLQQLRVPALAIAALGWIVLASGLPTAVFWKPAGNSVSAAPSDPPDAVPCEPGNLPNPAAAGAEAEEKLPGAPRIFNEFFPRPDASERSILAALDETVNIDFHEMALDDCIRALAEQAKVEPCFIAGQLAEEGIALDQPITLKLKGRRLKSALHLVLDPAQMTFFYEDEVLKITTRAHAGERLITRTYPIGDLCPELKVENGAADRKQVAVDQGGDLFRLALFQGFGANPRQVNPPAQDSPPADTAPKGGGMSLPMPIRQPTRFTNLMQAVTLTIEPDSWDELSGPGSIIAVAATNSLVIRQTWGVHQQVVQLLRDLRAAQRVNTAPAHPPGATAH